MSSSESTGKDLDPKSNSTDDSDDADAPTQFCIASRRSMAFITQSSFSLSDPGMRGVQKAGAALSAGSNAGVVMDTEVTFTAESALSADDSSAGVVGLTGAEAVYPVTQIA